MKILFVQTGGTIDKDYPHATQGWAFVIDEPAVKRILEKWNPSFDFEILSAMKKDSLEITPDDRQHLKKLIEQSPMDKIIVTHGTDTMQETARVLSSLSNNKTIAITGAMRPERFTNSDADMNVGMAVATVQTASPGVYICMHGLVIPHHQVDRNMETGQYRLLKEK